MIKQIEIIGLLATFLGAMRFLPIIHKVYKTRKTTNFPYTALFLALLSNILWIIYGTFDNTYANIVAGSLFFSVYAFILFIKFTSKK